MKKTRKLSIKKISIAFVIFVVLVCLGSFLTYKFNLKSDEVILFGNNDYEDGECALKNNIKTYLIKGLVFHTQMKIHF